MDITDLYQRTRPEAPLTISDIFSVDDLVHVLLLTILNPINTWIFSLLFYKWTGNFIWIKLSLLVIFGWTVSDWNNRQKRARGQKYKFRDSRLNVLITGGVQGLGLEIVKALLKEKVTKGSELYGCKIFVIDVLEIPEVLKGQDIELIRCDLSDEDDLEFALTRVEDKIKDKVDIFISNAAIVHEAMNFQNLKDDSISKIWKVNFWSFLKLARFVMKSKNEGDNNIIDMSRTHIISIASILGFISPNKLSMYSATKASQIALMDCLSHESGQAGLIVSCICPGQLTSPMFQDVHVPQEFLAPLVDHRKLSQKVLDIIKKGEQGLFVYPFYAHFIPLLKSLPFGIYELIRNYSKMDEQYH